jgi:hypothetical protein
MRLQVLPELGPIASGHEQVQGSAAKPKVPMLPLHLSGSHFLILIQESFKIILHHIDAAISYYCQQEHEEA